MHHAPGQSIGQQDNASWSRTSLGQSRHVMSHSTTTCLAWYRQPRKWERGEQLVAGSGANLGDHEKERKRCKAREREEKGTVFFLTLPVPHNTARKVE